MVDGYRMQTGDEPVKPEEKKPEGETEGEEGDKGETTEE